eukprot:TRINITY_DN60579_c0_g1_i1.p1 TRINITY_DN60579_c0_g1~~TRINITY_DN60579_c0_g1_i1.p1  ORF type:complete len:483 (+),score=104.70 TRINITY_DN60579_c0_g1_i1:46-1494(+)
MVDTHKAPGSDADWLESWSGWWELESRRDWDKFLSFQEIPEDAHEAAIKTVDRHRYTMTKDTFSMLHTIPSKNFALDYSVAMDWQWHESPYPKPTAKLYGAGHNAAATEKTKWRHRWTDYPRAFETELQQFIEGKNVHFTRELASPTELKFTVHVLKDEGFDKGTLVGPCLSTFRKDGTVTGKVKMAAKKGAGFYLKVAQAFLNGSPVKGGDWRRPIPRIKIDALGNAISDACSVAASLESKEVGVIAKVQTDQVPVAGGKSIPQICISMLAKSADIASIVAVSAYSVLGARMRLTGEMATVAPEPDASTAIVDPAGLTYIKGSPSDAGGAAGVIYKWLGISQEQSFPEPVVKAINAPLEGKFHAYGEKKCIHVVGPDFRGRPLSRQDAVGELAKAYKTIFTEFAVSGLPSLRLLPVSGGIFSGDFMPEMPGMTVEALKLGFAAVDAEQQDHILRSANLEMCIFMEKELQDFAQAFALQRAM